MDVFSYDTTLHGSSETGTIRLIDLQPIRDQSPLSCELRYVSLDDQPLYDAISYCWGGQMASKTISCNGKSLLITENLHDALCRFREPDKVVTLWADAICINQIDLKEKNEQVPLMGRIYSQANKVKVWLGFTDEDMTPTADLVSKLTTLAAMYSQQLNVTLEDVYDPDSTVWFELQYKMTKRKDLIAQCPPFLRLLQQPWFSRVWAIQEVALAYDRSWLYYGNLKLQWSDVSLAIYFSFKTGLFQVCMASDDTQQPRLVQRAYAMARTSVYYKQEKSQDGLGMAWMLCANRSAKATDPRDKIYGLLGMAKAGEGQSSQLFITPDYSVDTCSLYQRVTEKFLERHPKFYILSHGNTLNSSADHSCNLPSWVIDWDNTEMGDLDAAVTLDQEYESGLHSRYNACLADEWPKVYTVDGKVLKLTGFLHDEIVDCADLFSNAQFVSTYRYLSFHERGLLLEKGLYEAAQLWRLKPGSLYIHTGEDYLDAFTQTILMGDTLGQPAGALRAVTKSVLRISTWVSFLANSWFGRSPLRLWAGMKLFGRIPVLSTQPITVPELFSLVMRGMSNHVVFRTREGYIGVTSSQRAQIGDRVALVQGGFMPLLLRPADGSSWSLVGDAYIHGMMLGEAFDPNKCAELCL
ncbi:heterokaryon incompatibility protein-domain-containing protein, partial [Stachybotrys elegans]